MRPHEDREPCHWSTGLRPGAITSQRMMPAPGRRPALRFMDSLVSLLRMHGDHEPTPNPSQEGNGQDADGCLLPSWEGSGVGRFMEGITGATTSPKTGPRIPLLVARQPKLDG